MVGVAEAVAFVRVDDELGFDAEVAEGVPELEALRGGALAVAVADDDEGGGGDVFDVGDGAGLGVDGGVVVDGGAEEGNHPLIDGVLTVVAEPVGEAGAGDGGLEAMGLGDGEHGHEAAVAPAGDALAVGIDGVFGFHEVQAGLDVLEVAVAEVLAIGLGEGLALAEAAAGVRLQLEVAVIGPEVLGAPAGGNGGRGAAVDGDDDRVFLPGVVVGGEGEPALHVKGTIAPLDGFCAGGGRGVRVEMGELLEAGAAEQGVDLGCFGEALLGKGDEAAVPRNVGDGIFDGAATHGDLAEVEGVTRDGGFGGDVPATEQGMAAVVFDEAEGGVVRPDLPGGCAVDIGSDVGGLAALCVDGVEVTAGGALVGHKAANEGDLCAVGREAGDGDLKAV